MARRAAAAVDPDAPGHRAPPRGETGAVGEHVDLQAQDLRGVCGSAETEAVGEGFRGGGGGLQGQFARQGYLQVLGDSLPVYLSDPAVGLVLVFWIAVFPLVGYWAFEETDL